MARKIDWTTHAIELLVVFIGITAAFGLESYRESRNLRELEKKYLSSLRQDLNADIRQLQELIVASNASQLQVERLSLLTRKSPVPQDSIATYAAAMFRLSRFRPNRITYDALSSSGDLAIFSSFELKQQLGELYALYQQSHEQDDVAIDLVNGYIIPYFYQNFDLRDLKLLTPGALQKPMFSNFVQGFLVTVKQSRLLYKACLARSQELQARLEN